MVAVTENTVSDSLSAQKNNKQNYKIKNKINNINCNCNQNIIEKIKEQKKDLGLTFERGNRTLNAIRDRVWMNEWPVNIEKILNFTAPWFLKPYFYHNRTFWPWISGIEMLARGRFNRFGENNLILSKLLLEDDVNILAFYEWVNPNTGKGSGAYPFRTGICCVRTAIEDIINNI